MATERRGARLSHESWNNRTGFRLRFYDHQAERQSIWLGDISTADAEVWRKHVEHLIECGKLADPPSPVTTRWLASLPVRSRAKLERVGLVEANEASRSRKHDNRAPNRLGAFLDWYIANRSANPRTVIKWKHGRDCLLRYFKANRPLASITHADAEAWRNWLAKHGNVREGKERLGKDGQKTRGRTSLSEATVRRRTGQARQFFNYAIKAKLIESNPFAELAATVHGNDERKFQVTREMAQRMLDNAPGAEWRAIIALARFGGLRAPSEIMHLKWEDIDFANRRMMIFSPKLARNRNKGLRECPIFTELLPYLEDLAELAQARGAKPTDFVISSPRGSESVLRKPFLAILKLAGIPVYPKLFQNMRASRETELMDEFPIKDVCTWIGNSPKVAMEHYAMRRQESFDRAAGLDGCPNGWPKNGSSGQSPATSEPQPREDAAPNDQEKQGPNALLATAGNSRQNEKSRPGRTSADSSCVNVFQGQATTSPAVGQSVGQSAAAPSTTRLPDAFHLAAAAYAAADAREREAFKAAFFADDERFEVHCASCGKLKADSGGRLCGGCEYGPLDDRLDIQTAQVATSASDFITVTQIAKRYVDIEGHPRSKSWHRMQLANLQQQSGFAKATYLKSDVDALYSERRFALSANEDREPAQAQSEWEARVLDKLRKIGPNLRRKIEQIIELFSES